MSSVAMASTEIRLLALSCSGNEENFYNCSGFSWGNYTSQCEGQQAARIKCTKKAGFNHGCKLLVLQGTKTNAGVIMDHKLTN